MKKMPLVIAFICGMLAIMMAQQSGVMNSDGGALGGRDIVTADEIMTDQNMSAPDKKKYAKIKDDAVKMLSPNSDYELKKQADLKVIPLVNCVNHEHEMDHKIYSLVNNGKNVLLVLCHGYHDENNEYVIFMHETARADYVQAVEESLAYWARKGKLRNAQFDQVFLFTCFSGYAQQENKMPTFDINMYMANNNRDVNFYKEEIVNGETILHLYRGIPKSYRGSRSNYSINSVLENAINSDNQPALSADEMKGIQVLGIPQSY